MTNPSLIGWVKLRTDFFKTASFPIYKSFCYKPITTVGSFGLPTTQGNVALGASSPENPALIMPLPLSITMAFVYSDIYEILYL